MGLTPEQRALASQQLQALVDAQLAQGNLTDEEYDLLCAALVPAKIDEAPKG